jgi:hypothetical protein
MKSLVLIATLMSMPVFGQTSATVDPWSGWRFLLGDWETVDSGGTPGQASAGTAAFALELQNHVLVRRSWAEYPPAKMGGAPPRHDDLMIIYPGDHKSMSAIYFDSEGHVIRYHVDEQTAGGIRLVSDPEPGSPRFRLSYRESSPGVVAGRFEIAPPGKPDQFSVYLDWKARRKQ